jgi:CubicO group peptidase (beta-lactamase class C family)
VARAASDLQPGQAFDPLADYWVRVVTRRDPGHSGLFSTGPDLASWAIGMMRALNDEADPLHDVAQFVLGDMFEMRDEEGRRVRRTRGFLAREDDTLFGPILEHTGFTGCALWLDPQRELAVILLTCGADGESARWRRMADDVLRSIRIGARHGGS